MTNCIKIVNGPIHISFLTYICFFNLFIFLTYLFFNTYLYVHGFLPEIKVFAFVRIRLMVMFQVKKALELYEQLRQRMGVVIVGPSGSGKSTLWRILRQALAKTGQLVKQYVMNPKAMPRTQVQPCPLVYVSFFSWSSV